MPGRIRSFGIYGLKGLLIALEAIKNINNGVKILPVTAIVFLLSVVVA
jgi:hypothetical protein